MLAGIAHNMMVATDPALVLSSVKRCGEGLGVDPNKTSWCRVRLMGSPESTVRVPDGSSRTEIRDRLAEAVTAGPGKAVTAKARPAADREVSLGNR
jgi:hypothetical protein